MQSLHLLFTIFLTSSLSWSQTETFTVSNGRIIDPCGNEFIPIGVNYSLLDDWYFPGNLANGRERSSEIIASKSNTVRIMWYVNYGNASRPAYTLAHLDSVISRFAAANVVSIIELHDFTHTYTDTNLVNTVGLAFWTSQPVVDLLHKHRSHVWLNVANEYGPFRYSNGQTQVQYNAQIQTWSQHYRSMISAIRQAGITVPIVIDAPSYGMDHLALINNGLNFINHDPLSNIILSAHAYWDDTISNILSIIDQMDLIDVPIFLGEIANRDADCEPLNQYQAILQHCQQIGMGWLAWTWNRDSCPARNLVSNQDTWNSTTDGLFTHPTAYGNDIFHNTDYGIYNKSVLACFEGLSTEKEEHVIQIYPNPTSGNLTIDAGSLRFNQIAIYDLAGKNIQTTTYEAQLVKTLHFPFPSGTYILELKDEAQNAYRKTLIIQ